MDIDTPMELLYDSDYDDDSRVLCSDGTCFGISITCELPSGEVEYLCPEHAAENGYCAGCGTYIAGWIEFGSYCDTCQDQINRDVDMEDDYDDWDLY